MVALKRLSVEEAYRALSNHERWIVERKEIYRDFRFKDFAAALKFVNNVGRIAEELNHHPNILLHEYCFVRVGTYTHVVDGITEKDVELVKALDDALEDTQPLPKLE